MARYERVVFLQGEEADEVLGMIDDGDMSGAFEHLKQWHYPGEHETSDHPAMGSADEYEYDGDYIMSWNDGLQYVGLEFDSDPDADEDDELDERYT